MRWKVSVGGHWCEEPHKALEARRPGTPPASTQRPNRLGFTVPVGFVETHFFFVLCFDQCVVPAPVLEERQQGTNQAFTITLTGRRAQHSALRDRGSRMRRARGFSDECEA